MAHYNELNKWSSMLGARSGMGLMARRRANKRRADKRRIQNG